MLMLMPMPSRRVTEPVVKIRIRSCCGRKTNHTSNTGLQCCDMVLTAGLVLNCYHAPAMKDGTINDIYAFHREKEFNCWFFFCVKIVENNNNYYEKTTCESNTNSLGGRKACWGTFFAREMRAISIVARAVKDQSRASKKSRVATNTKTVRSWCNA